MSKSIDYGNLMHRAMRGLIQEVLTRVSAEGLPGAHHFFIKFDTNHPGVEMADWLHERFPGDMNIVVQHWFDNLDVTNQGFHITLNFGDRPEPLYVPFDAIRTFVDPSVEFGLRFDAHEEDDEEEEVEEAEMDEDVEPEAHDAEIIRLDTFRKP